MRYLIDTNICVYIMNNHPAEVLEKLAYLLSRSQNCIMELLKAKKLNEILNGYRSFYIHLQYYLMMKLRQKNMEKYVHSLKKKVRLSAPWIC